MERERYHFAGNSQRRARPICESSAINRLSLYSLGTNSVWHAHSLKEYRAIDELERNTVRFGCMSSGVAPGLLCSRHGRSYKRQMMEQDRTGRL